MPPVPLRSATGERFTTGDAIPAALSGRKASSYNQIPKQGVQTVHGQDLQIDSFVVAEGPLRHAQMSCRCIPYPRYPVHSWIHRSVTV